MLRHWYPKEVALKNGQKVTLRLLDNTDSDKLYAFFQALRDEDRLFLRHDVTDRDLIAGWVANIDLRRIIPLVAEDGDKIVADGTLHLATHGWSQHAGEIRLVTGPTHRRIGLGTVVARELVRAAEDLGLEKLRTHVIEDDVGSVTTLRRLGFVVAAVLEDWVKDQRGNKRNLAIMTNSVVQLTQVMEEWILGSIQPGFRAPPEGALQ
jgi:RimJ/RimL family protein N-acetyltransferase